MWGFHANNQININGMDMVIYNLEQLVAQGNATFSREAVIAFLGGFSGAFFALLFERMATQQDKKRERYKKHHDAVVKVEYTLVKQQDNISRLVYALESSSVNLMQQPPVLPANRFPKLKILEDIELELGDIDLINEVSDYWLAIERVNADTETINRLLDSMNTALLSGITLARGNFEHVSNSMKSLAKHLKNNVLDENVSLNAYVVLLLERESARNKILKALQGHKIIEHNIKPEAREGKKQEIYTEIETRSVRDEERLNKNV